MLVQARIFLATREKKGAASDDATPLKIKPYGYTSPYIAKYSMQIVSFTAMQYFGVRTNFMVTLSIFSVNKILL